MNKFKEFVIVLIAFIATIGYAQENENSLLWKIEGDSIQTSYIFGTIHMLPQKDFKLSDKVKNAYDASDKIAMELDMDEQGFFMEMMKHMALNEGENLKSYMEESEYEKLDGFLKEKLKLGMDKFEKSKPFFLTSTLLITFIGEQIASYEMTFIQMSKNDAKEIKGLETIEDQMAAISESKSYEEQIDDLIEMLDNYDEIAEFYNDLIALYKKEDLKGIYKGMEAFFEDDMVSREKMLDHRNRNWIPVITDYSKEHKMFYAVGAAHLGGEQGILSLLKKAGYKVTPLF